MFLNVDNVGAERMSSGKLFQATGPVTQNARLPSCIALSWERPNHHEQRNGEQKGWEQWTLECTSRTALLCYIVQGSPNKVATTYLS